LLALELGELQQLGFTLTLTGFDDHDLQDLLAEAAADIADATSLRERFGAPPFTILNARDGWWQARGGVDRARHSIRVGARCRAERLADAGGQSGHEQDRAQR
jgi:hypothetical protein